MYALNHKIDDDFRRGKMSSFPQRRISLHSKYPMAVLSKAKDILKGRAAVQ